MPPVRLLESAPRRSPRQRETTGTRAISRLAPSAVAIAAQNTVQSSVAPSAHAPNGSAPTSTWKAPAATTAPATPAARPTTMDSASSCCSSRRRSAPNAARTASSVARPSTCPSMRDATLVQAMSRIIPIAASVASSAGRMEPTRNSRTGVTAAFFVLSHCAG